jgi:hypothetical protein
MKRILTFLYFIIILLLSIAFYFKPDYNWDILPYMALSLDINPIDVNAGQILPYAIAQGELPPKKYAALIDSSSAYRYAAATDPLVFQHELGFYRTRPLYVWLITCFHKAGVSFTKATVLPSVLSYFLFGMMLLFWVSGTKLISWGNIGSFFSPQSRRGAENKSIDHDFLASLRLSGEKEKRSTGVLTEIKQTVIPLIFCLAILFSPFMVNTARLSTPDMLTSLFLISGCWFLLENRSVPAVSVLFLLALLTRYDCILLIILILVWLLITERRNFLYWLPLIAVMIIITIIQYRDIFFIIKQVVFIMPSSDRLAGTHGSNIFTSYFSSLINGFPSFFHSQVALISFIFLADIILRRRVLHAAWKDPSLLFALFVFAYIPLRYIVHPVIDDRFLVGSYVILSVFFVRTFHLVLEQRMPDSKVINETGEVVKW